MENNFPTRAELDTITEAWAAVENQYFEAVRAFEDDHRNRKNKVDERRAELNQALTTQRESHAAAMQIVGAAIAEGRDATEATEQANSIALEIYMLEEQAKALATQGVKPNEELFSAVLAAYKRTLEADETTRAARDELHARAEDAEQFFRKLASDTMQGGHRIGNRHNSEIVKLYESVHGPLNCPDYQKAQRIAAM